MIKQILLTILSFLIVISVMGCQPEQEKKIPASDAVEATILALDSTALVEEPQTLVEETSTPIPTEIPVELPSATFLPATATTIPTRTPTAVVFNGFRQYFRLYRAWYSEGNTLFYFLDAGIDFTMYAKADEYELVCEADPDNLTGMICVHEGEEIKGDLMNFTFFVDEDRTRLVFEKSYQTELVSNIIYHHQFDCPDRGKDVTCEQEYRLYDGRCYYAYTCYDACGLYYSKDNIPENYHEFQGFTGPCN